MSGSISDAFAEAGVPPPPRPAAEAEVIRELDPDLLRQLQDGPITGALVAVTNHAVERFHLHFCPDGDLGEAKSLLYARIHRSAYVPSRPDWILPWFARHSGDQERIENSGFLVADEDLAMPLRLRTLPATPGRKPPRPLTVVTCLYRYS